MTARQELLFFAITLGVGLLSQLAVTLKLLAFLS
jgi:hypothetical protein